MYQRPQHKTRYTEPDRRESRGLECIGTEDFLNRTQITQVLRSTAIQVGLNETETNRGLISKIY